MRDRWCYSTHEVSLFQRIRAYFPLASVVTDPRSLKADLSPDGVALQQVQIRPWNLNDSDFVMDGSQPLDPRKTIFVGGVPRPLRAGQPPV